MCFYSPNDEFDEVELWIRSVQSHNRFETSQWRGHSPRQPVKLLTRAFNASFVSYCNEITFS